MVELWRFVRETKYAFISSASLFFFAFYFAYIFWSYETSSMLKFQVIFYLMALISWIYVLSLYPGSNYFFNDIQIFSSCEIKFQNICWIDNFYIWLDVFMKNISEFKKIWLARKDRNLNPLRLSLGSNNTCSLPYFILMSNRPNFQKKIFKPERVNRYYLLDTDNNNPKMRLKVLLS